MLGVSYWGGALLRCLSATSYGVSKEIVRQKPANGLIGSPLSKSKRFRQFASARMVVRCDQRVIA